MRNRGGGLAVIFSACVINGACVPSHGSLAHLPPLSLVIYLCSATFPVERNVRMMNLKP